MTRPTIDLPSAPRVHAISDEALALAPYGGTLLLRTLRVAGDAPPYAPSVAIVGTRKADPEARAFTHGLAASLAEKGVVIVSGGALGIDAAAHEGALERGRTLAVLASGLRRAYPSAHAGLFARIARSGALVTAYGDDDPPLAYRLLERNELIAALARVVIVVQAPERSGALSTAAAARRFGRALFAVPSAPWDPKGRGNLALLREGARPCTGPSEILAALGLDASDTRSPRERPLPSELSKEARALHAWLGARPRHVDELVSEAGLSLSQVQRALVELSLHGLVAERQGGRYARSGRADPLSGV